MEKKHENPPENLCSILPIMHGIDSYSARSKYHLTIKNLVCTHFYGPLILGVWLPDYKSLKGNIILGLKLTFLYRE